MHDELPLARRLARRGEPDAEPFRGLGPGGVDVDELDVGPRHPASEVGDAAADHAPTDDAHAVADQRRASQRALTAVSIAPASTARPAGTPAGTGTTAEAGTT